MHSGVFRVSSIKTTLSARSITILTLLILETIGRGAESHSGISPQFSLYIRYWLYRITAGYWMTCDMGMTLLKVQRGMLSLTAQRVTWET